MAKRMWPDVDPLGRRFRLERRREARLVHRRRHRRGFPALPGETAAEEVFPSAYVPYSFDPALNTGLTIRVAREPRSITTACASTSATRIATLPMFQVSTMEDLRQRSFWQDRLFGWMFSVFGAIALLLASVGVYGVLSYSVSQRRPGDRRARRARRRTRRRDEARSSCRD